MQPLRLLRSATPFRPPPARPAGFSLVELAIVVLIVSILLTMGLAAFSVQVDTVALSATQKRQETIKDALIAYLRTNRRLPCPETTAIAGNTPTGTETRLTANDPTTQCASFWGTIPFATLGLSREAALDGYGNFFSYFVSSSASPPEPDWTLTSTTGVPGFNVGNPGRFSVTENGIPTAEASNLAAVVVISHGKNGAGAFTLKGTRIPQSPAGTNEFANAPDTGTTVPPGWTAPATTGGCGGSCPSPGIRQLFIRGWTDDPGSPGGIYDDVVLVLRPNDLLGPIIKDGAMKSAEALVQEQLAYVRDTAIAETLSTCAPPTTLTKPIDPWGLPIDYVKVGGTLTASTPPSAIAFQVWSSGPNRINDSGTLDDRSLSTGRDVTYGQVRARIPLPLCLDPPP